MAKDTLAPIAPEVDIVNPIIKCSYPLILPGDPRFLSGLNPGSGSVTFSSQLYWHVEKLHSPSLICSSFGISTRLISIAENGGGLDIPNLLFSHNRRAELNSTGG